MSVAGLGSRQVAGDETGSVTAELAVGLPVVVLLIVLVATLAAAAVTELRCDDAARAGAREAALGSDDAAVRATIGRVAGDAVTVEVVRADGWTTVRVGTAVSFGPWSGPVRVSAEAVAKDEP